MSEHSNTPHCFLILIYTWHSSSKLFIKAHLQIQKQQTNMQGREMERKGKKEGNILHIYTTVKKINNKATFSSMLCTKNLIFVMDRVKTEPNALQILL